MSSNISEDAKQALYNRLKNAQERSIPATDVHSIRAALHAEFQPRAKRALSNWDVCVSQTDIYGMMCQVITPSSKPSLHTILYFFGGGYVSGSPDYDLPITAPLSYLTQATIIAPYYPLAPEHPFPAAFDVCFEFYKNWVGTIENTGFTICGESAGGGLAAAIVNAAITHKLPLPKTALLFSPWLDLTETHMKSGALNGDPTLKASDISLFTELYLGSSNPTSINASPGLKNDLTDWPATYLSTGSKDFLSPGVKDFHKRLILERIETYMFTARDLWHVFELYDELEEAQVSLAQAAKFTLKILKM